LGPNVFFFKRFFAQKIQRDTQGYKIVPLTNLPYLSFAEASDRISTVTQMSFSAPYTHIPSAHVPPSVWETKFYTLIKQTGKMLFYT